MHQAVHIRFWMQDDRDVDPLGGIPVEVRTNADKGSDLGNSSVAKEEAESLTDEQPGDEAQEGSSPSLQQPSDRPFLSQLDTRPPAGQHYLNLTRTGAGGEPGMV